jgi:hypothetical protein
MRILEFVLLIAFLATTISGCSSQIANKIDAGDVKVVLGKTNKKDLSALIGFPSARKIDQKTNHEIWAYANETQLTYVTPKPIGARVDRIGTDLRVTGYYGPSTSYVYGLGENFSKADVIYVFDKQGVLVHVIRGRREKK